MINNITIIIIVTEFFANLYNNREPKPRFSWQKNITAYPDSTHVQNQDIIFDVL